MKKILSVIGFAWLFAISQAQTLSCANVDTLVRHHFADSNFVVIDVCSDNAYTGGHLQNAIHIYLYKSTFSSDIDTLDRSKTYLLHCTSGGMSASAMSIMSGKNFTKVYDISNGMTAWKSGGYPYTVSTQKSVIRFLSANEFNKKLQTATAANIMDLRSGEAFAAKHLSNATNVDTTKLGLKACLADVDKEYFVYGLPITSADSMAYYNLYLAGYKSVYVLKGGIEAWQAENLPVETATVALMSESKKDFSLHYCNGALFFDGLSENAMVQFQLFCSNGDQLQRGLIIGSTSVAVGQLHAGEYFISGMIDGAVFTKKIVVQ